MNGKARGLVVVWVLLPSGWYCPVGDTAQWVICHCSICFALYSASSSPSSLSHSSLSPTTCCSAGFFHLLTPLNYAEVSLCFGCTGLFGFWAPGGSVSHLSCHSARFWACFAALSALACILHAICAALRSLRALAASVLVPLAALASSSASRAEIITSPVKLHPELVLRSCWAFFFWLLAFSFAAKACHNFLQWRSWRTLCAGTVW